jgi:hypothetical protein
MRRIFFFIACLFISGLVAAQSLKKYTLAGSGCSYYGFCEISFDPSKSEDSSQIWTGECLKDEINYGIICVKLKEPVTDLTMAEDLMINYSDYLKNSFKITRTAGYGKGHRLQNKENTRGVIDYWGDMDKNNWKIKAWTDGKFIGFMFVYSLKELPEPKINLFLDGFRLPG